MSMLITLFVGLLIFAVVWYIVDLFPIDARIKRILQIILLVILLIWLLSFVVPFQLFR